LAMNPARAAREAARHGTDGGASTWTPPVLRTVAAHDEGIAELVEALERHFRYLERTGVLRERRRARLRERVVEVVESLVRQRLWRDEATGRWLDAQLPDLESGRTNPFAAAGQLLERSADLLTRHGVT
jgi:LAO/AO transport system kinase